MAEYYKPYSAVSAVAPQFDTSALQRAGALFEKSLNSIRDKEVEDFKLAQEQEKYKNALGFQQRAEERDIAKIAEERAKTLATNNALAVIENPNVVTSLNTSASDATSQNALAMYNSANADGVVTSQEQALLDSTYQKDLIRDVLTSGSADQKSLFDARQAVQKLNMQEAENQANAKYRMQSLQNQASEAQRNDSYRSEMLKGQNEWKNQEKLAKLTSEINLRNKAKELNIDSTLPIDMVAKQVEKELETKWINPSTGKVENKPKSQIDFDKEKTKANEDYINLLESKSVDNLVNADRVGNKTLNYLDLMQKAGVSPTVAKSIITTKATENKNNTFEESLGLGDLNKKYVADPDRPGSFVGLGDYLEKIQANPDKYKDVIQNGKGYTLQVLDLTDINKTK